MLKEEEAKEKLEEILNQDEYRIYYADTRNSLQIWWDELVAWLADLLSRLFPSMENTNGTAGNILILLLGLVIIFMIVMLIFYISKYRRNQTIRKKQPFSTNEMEWSYHQHITEAKTYEEAEDYSLATRHLFLGTLLYFHEKEWLVAKIWKTNWEYYEELNKGDKGRADLFFDFALLFDRATYGKQQVLKEDYQEYRDIVMNWINASNEKR